MPPEPTGRLAPAKWLRPRRRDSIVLTPWAPALVFLPLLILVIGTYFNGALLWHEKLDATAWPNLAACLSHRHEAIGRTRLLAAFLPYLLVSILILLYFLREFIWLLGPQSRRRLALPIILFLIPAVYIAVAQGIQARDPLAALGAGFYETAFNRIASCGMEKPPMLFEAHDELQPLVILRRLAIAFSLLLILAAGSVIVGTISTVAGPIRSLPASVRAYYRRMQRERLDRYLYLSALLLVFGLFVMDSAMRWPAEFAEDKKLYTEHVNALMLYNGIFYSTILAAYFVPAALWQRSRYARLPKVRKAEGDPAAAPPETGLAGKLSPSRLLKTVLALLSPAIAGVLAQLLESAGL